MSRRLEEDDKVAVFPGPAARAERPRSATGYRSWRAAALAAGLAGLVAARRLDLRVPAGRQLADAAGAEAGRPGEPARGPAPAPDPGSSGARREGRADRERDSRRTRRRPTSRFSRPTSRSRRSSRRRRTLTASRSSTSGPDLANPADVVRGSTGAEPERRSCRPTRLAVLSSGDRERRHRRPGDRDPGRRRQRRLERARTAQRREEPAVQQSRLPAGFLKPGRYTIQLYETVNGRRVKRESYKIRVE